MSSWASIADRFMVHNIGTLAPVCGLWLANQNQKNGAVEIFWQRSVRDNGFEAVHNKTRIWEL